MTRASSPDSRPVRETLGPKITDEPGRHSWRDLAACRHVDTEVFFPVSRSGMAVAEARRAKAVCALCPVRLPCLSYALATHQAYGVWGGYDEEERRILHRLRAAEPEEGGPR